MKVAYLVSSPRAASYRVGQMILPQLEANTHKVQVVAMFFFDDNALILQKGNPIGERLAKIAREKGIILMICDACALERGLAIGQTKYIDQLGKGRTTPADCKASEILIEGVEIGCFPDLYEKLANKVDLVITI